MKTRIPPQAFRNAFDHPFVVAEISGNHNGSLTRALELVEKAAEAGADAVKIQTYTPDTITLPVDLPNFRISEGHELWGGRTLYDLYQDAHTPWEWHAEIFKRAKDLGIQCFSTPFDETAVDFLETLENSIYKIASIEIVDLPLIKYAAQTGKPLIISTGAANLADIENAVRAAKSANAKDITLLVCTSAYPATPADANLSRMKSLEEMFEVNVGLSDHTLGLGVSLAAAALGSSVIEKHLTLKRADGGVDAAFSMEPEELKTLIEESKNAFLSIGSPTFPTFTSENESRSLRPSLWVYKEVKAGEIVSESNVKSVRPSGGLEPIWMETIIGKRFATSASVGTPVTWGLLT